MKNGDLKDLVLEDLKIALVFVAAIFGSMFIFALIVDKAIKCLA